MIQITPQMRIFLAVDPVDFRKGIDGFVRLCKSVMNKDPFSGYLFVFSNKRRSSLKILGYDGQGFWLCHKRLSHGRFLWWPQSQDEAAISLQAHELQQLIWNGNVEQLINAPFWKKLG